MAKKLARWLHYCGDCGYGFLRVSEVGRPCPRGHTTIYVSEWFPRRKTNGDDAQAS